jgi:catabolite regulation protein CreA
MTKLFVLSIFVSLAIAVNALKLPFRNGLTKAIGSLSTCAVLLNPLMNNPVMADSREVGSMTTSGIIFKDTLKINAFSDPKVQGVTIYLADFDRPLAEKLTNDPFNDPSATALACVQNGPIVIGDINKSPDGEEVFEASRNLFFKVGIFWLTAMSRVLYSLSLSSIYANMF